MNLIELFISSAIQIPTWSRGSIPFNMYWYQQGILDHLDRDRRVIVQRPRRAGVSVLMQAYSLAKAVIGGTKTPAILALNTSSHACDEYMDNIEMMFVNLPTTARGGVYMTKSYSSGRIDFSNGSAIFVRKYDPSYIKGHSCTDLLMHDFAYCQHAGILGTLQHLFSEANVLIESHPTGYLTDFDLMFSDATAGLNGFTPLMITAKDIANAQTHISSKAARKSDPMSDYDRAMKGI